MDAYVSKSRHDCEKKVFLHVGLLMLAVSIFCAFYFNLLRAVSVFLGFLIVYFCYHRASKTLLAHSVSADASQNLSQFSVLVKASLLRLLWAAVLVSVLLWGKKQVPSFPIDSVYLVLGFILSVIIYRVRVVLGEVSNV